MMVISFSVKECLICWCIAVCIPLHPVPTKWYLYFTNSVQEWSVAFKSRHKRSNGALITLHVSHFTHHLPVLDLRPSKFWPLGGDNYPGPCLLNLKPTFVREILHRNQGNCWCKTAQHKLISRSFLASLTSLRELLQIIANGTGATGSWLELVFQSSTHCFM